MMHGQRQSGGQHGVVNTKSCVVKKMLDLIGYSANHDLSTTSILEPAAGDGAFVLEIIRRLYSSSKLFNFSFSDSLANLHFCELDKEIAEKLTNNINALLNSYGVNYSHTNLIIGDFLLTPFNRDFDFIVGNPPYVRNENIPDHFKKAYLAKYSTFTHRSDLYIPFYQRALELLSPNGTLSFICSNRWLKNQYGSKLRHLITHNYYLESIIDLEDADVFTEEVLGYPAITNLRASKSAEFTKYISLHSLDDFIDFKYDINDHKLLPLNSHEWFRSDLHDSPIASKLVSIESRLFKIGIGVATGRDSIFISDKFENIVESELLLPIIRSKDIKSDEINWSGAYVVNPYDSEGRLINLADYPNAQNYFNHHKEELSKRHVAKKNPDKFYKTIDRIYSNLTFKPKILLPDISANRFIHVDKGTYYPHHNVYYITGPSYNYLCLLASILMSDFLYQQLLHIGNKMKGGYPRWQSQNLRKLLIPRIEIIPDNLKHDLINAYHSKNYNVINSIINENVIDTFPEPHIQQTLFDISAN